MQSNTKFCTWTISGQPCTGVSSDLPREDACNTTSPCSSVPAISPSTTWPWWCLIWTESASRRSNSDGSIWIVSGFPLIICILTYARLLSRVGRFAFLQKFNLLNNRKLTMISWHEIWLILVKKLIYSTIPYSIFLMLCIVMWCGFRMANFSVDISISSSKLLSSINPLYFQLVAAWKSQRQRSWDAIWSLCRIMMFSTF